MDLFSSKCATSFYNARSFFFETKKIVDKTGPRCKKEKIEHAKARTDKQSITINIVIFTTPFFGSDFNALLQRGNLLDVALRRRTGAIVKNIVFGLNGLHGSPPKRI